MSPDAEYDRLADLYRRTMHPAVAAVYAHDELALRRRGTR